eukprot:5853467-Prymnesium_polylepis.1
MAPAAAANEQTVRARVRLQGSSSAAAVGTGARRVTAHSAATRGWCAVRVGACGERADRAISTANGQTNRARGGLLSSSSAAVGARG